DDFVIPLLAKMRSGCSIVFDNKAIAREETPLAIASEFQRRVRIGAGGFQSICLLWRLLDPRRGWIAFTFFSHKILRWLCPFFLLTGLASNFALLDEPFYAGFIWLQIGFYLASIVSAAIPAEIKWLKPLRLTTMFTTMNLALLVGFWRWLCGSQKAAWQRTARLAEVHEVIG